MSGSGVEHEYTSRGNSVTGDLRRETIVVELALSASSPAVYMITNHGCMEPISPAPLKVNISVGGIGRINNLFSLFHQEKKGIHDAVQPWNTRNLTNFRQHSQYRPFPLGNHAAAFAGSNLVSWLSQTDLIGFPNNGSKGHEVRIRCSDINGGFQVAVVTVTIK